MSLISSLIPRSGARGLSNFPSFQSLAEVYGLPVIHKSYLAEHFARCSSLYHRDLLGHYGCVNAIEFSNNGGEYIVSGGDDRRVVVWNVEKCVYGTGSPVIVKGEHRSNIFCAVFDNDNRHIFSAGNDNQALRHDLTTGETIGMYYHDDPVYGLSVHPEDSNVFLTACDDGNVLLWDARTTTGSSECIAHYTSAFHAAVFNPVDPHLIATANSRKGVQLWDVRVPKNCLQQFSNAMPQLCAMGLKWNMTGHMLTALRRRLPPVLYHVSRPSAIAEFHHPGYSNVCTMKSNCFAGNKDQYIVSGSDDFNVYIWEVPADWEDHEKQVTVGRAFLVLNGHRSIVNQVRFNPTSHMLVSAGVEKVVKVWSPFPIPGGHNSSSEEGSTSIRRQLYSHHEYLGLVHTRGLSIPYEHVQESTEEDPCMLAFFDSLIDREKNDLHSDSHESFGDDFNLSFILQAGNDESSDSDTVGISVSRLRDILYQPSQDTPSGEENEGVLRRLRHLSNSAAIRDLLHAVADTSSSSSDDEEEMEQRVQAVLPEIPRDEENEHSSGDAPVRFNRCQAHGSRSYRCRHQTGVDSSSSSSSHSMSDSSLSGSGDEHTQSNHEEDSNRNSPGRMEDSNISSSSGTDNAKHKKSRDALGCDRVLKQRKKRSSQERHGVSSVNGLQECETTGHTQENGQNQPNITTTATITQHENGQNQPHITTNHCSTADCKDRLESSCCSDNGITNCEANNRSQSQLNQVKDKTESSRMDGNDSRDESHRIASEGCSVSKCISNGCTDQSEHVPPHPDCNSEDCSKEREGGPTSSRTKINGC